MGDRRQQAIGCLLVALPTRAGLRAPASGSAATGAGSATTRAAPAVLTSLSVRLLLRSRVPSRRHLLPERRDAWRFAVAGGVVLSVGLVLAFVIGRDPIAANARDLAANEWFFNLGEEQPWTASLADAVSWFAGGARNVVVVPIALLILLLCRQWRWAVFLAVSSQAGLVVSSALKATVARERPPFTEVDDFQRFLSFPSGHTFAGITVWLAMGIICWYLLPRPWSTIAGVVLAVVGLLNGPSRLILGKHWLTDVLGAWLVASGWLLVVWAAFLWFLAPRPSPPLTDGEAAPTLRG